MLLLMQHGQNFNVLAWIVIALQRPPPHHPSKLISHDPTNFLHVAMKRSVTSSLMNPSSPHHRRPPTIQATSNSDDEYSGLHYLNENYRGNYTYNESTKNIDDDQFKDSLLTTNYNNISLLELSSTPSMKSQQSANAHDDRNYNISRQHRSLLSSPDDVVNKPIPDVVVTTLPLASSSPFLFSSFTELPTNIAPLKSVLLLNLVAILWGTQHAVIKLIVNDSSVGTFTLMRFGLAALLASPYTPGLQQYRFPSRASKDIANGNKTMAEKLADEEECLDKASRAIESSLQVTNNNGMAWRWGLEMGFWMFLGFAFQAIGLETTTAQRSGFLLYLNVKFVPFLARILLGRQISIPTWISALVAFMGTTLLATTTGEGVNGAAPLVWTLNTGDWWSIAAAAASAMFILRLELASVQVPSSAQLNAACLWTVTLLSLAWSSGQTVASSVIMSSPSIATSFTDSWTTQIQHLVLTHGPELVYLGGVTTALANYVQAKAQKDVSATRASVIYAMDPVYGAFFSYWILGETLSVWGMVGAAMIALAAATNALVDFGNEQEKV